METRIYREDSVVKVKKKGNFLYAKVQRVIIMITLGDLVPDLGNQRPEDDGVGVEGR